MYYWVDGESNRVLNLEGAFTLLPTVPYMCGSFVKRDSKFNCGVVLVGSEIGKLGIKQVMKGLAR